MILVLTVGTNPLPCFVVSKYLLEKKEIRKIILIYSEKNKEQDGTKEYADNLEKLIKRDFQGIEIEKISLSNVSSAKDIRNDLDKTNWDVNFKYHLNYTGGTKSMSVHVYNYFKEKFGNNVVFSYLDARNYVLVRDDGNYEPEKGDLRTKVSININDLLSLHSYKIRSNSYEDVQDLKVFNDVLQIFETAISEGQLKDFYNWYNEIRNIKTAGFDKVKKFKDQIKKESPVNLKYIVENFDKNITEIAKSILESFPKDKKIHDTIDGRITLWVPNESLNNNDFKERVKDTWEYLDGKWLEHYVYNKLKEKLVGKGLKEKENFGWSLKAEKEKNRDFELDFFIIKGYQLIGISITTDKQPHICKSKGFEIIHRVRQIGGDESIALLITGLEKDSAEKLSAEKLKEDLKIHYGTNEERLKVFGIDDWKDIDNEILKFI
jgi:hypothetical protein